MNSATPQMRNFAMRLILNETNGTKSLEVKSAAVFLVCEKLRPQLEPLVGKSGFRSLLSRSLSLAVKEVPELRAVNITTDGALEGPQEIYQDVNPNKILEGRLVLLAQLLDLLVAFIGENLTLRLVNEVWPKVTLNNLDLEERERK